jgi:hypothetical protein
VMITMTRIDRTLPPVILCDLCHKRRGRSDHAAAAVFDTPADLIGRWQEEEPRSRGIWRASCSAEAVGAWREPHEPAAFPTGVKDVLILLAKSSRVMRRRHPPSAGRTA